MPNQLQPLKFKEMIGYGLGDFGYMLLWTLIGSFLTFFYTDVVGIAAGFVGTLMFIVRIWDGVSDFAMGAIVDRTKSKYGKARPYLLWMPIPLAITTILIFTVPEMSMTGKYFYTFITYSLFILMYTAVTIPYKTLLGQMTQNAQSRSKIGLIGAVFIGLAALIVNVTAQPIASSIGGQKGWILTAALFGALSVIVLFITFFSTKERVEPSQQFTEKKSNQTLILEIKLLFKNEYWLIVSLFCIILYVFFGLVGAEIYYATYILGDTGYFSIINLVKFLPTILILFVIAPFIKCLGKRNTALLGGVFIIISAIVKWLSPTSLIFFLIGSALQGMAKGLMIATIYVMINDTVDYGEWKNGVRTGGLVNSSVSFGMKIGTGLGTALIGWLLAFGGYTGGGETQSDLAIQMLMALNIYIPLLLGIAVVIILWKYKLDKIYPTVIHDLNKQ